MIKTVLIFLATLIFTGCSATNVLKPEASHVRIVDEIFASQRCEYLGEVIGSEGKIYNAIFISNKDLTRGARSDMRNQTFDMGGNLIVTDFNALTYTSSTVYVGNAYHCPKVLNERMK